MPTIYPKDFFKHANKKIELATCFVLMAFGEKYSEVYEIIRETLESEELNMECTRADDFHEPHIIETILKNITRSEYIIADLTESNPNVFYELGLAHCIKNINKVVVLTQDMKFVPFDLRQFRCIVYEQSISGSKKLKQELVKTFQDAAKDTFRIKLIEGRTVPFGKRLVGKDNFLYELEFECPFAGHDGVKIQIHFTQLSVDKTRTQLGSQFLYLSEEKRADYIENIPWTVSLVRTSDREAIVSIDKGSFMR